MYRNDDLTKQKLSGCGDELCARDYLLIPGGTGVLPGTEASVGSKEKKKLESRDRWDDENFEHFNFNYIGLANLLSLSEILKIGLPSQSVRFSLA